MKYRDSKRWRNYRVSRQKLREWKVQRNIIGKPTGAFDVNGNEIKIGDKVKVKDYWDAIVLYSDLGYIPQKYPLLLRAFDNEGDKDIYHPDNYGKWPLSSIESESASSYTLVVASFMMSIFLVTMLRMFHGS